MQNYTVKEKNCLILKLKDGVVFSENYVRKTNTTSSLCANENGAQTLAYGLVVV